MFSTVIVTRRQGDISAKARLNMVESQIGTNRVDDQRLLQEVLPTLSDKAMVVGAGTGCAMAMLANLVRSVVAMCHHGGRSASATAWLRSQGFANAINLVGGIDAWARLVAPELQRY